MLKFSIIIPCYHDEEKLRSLLEQLCNIPDKAWEIIVVDGADSELCQRICSLFKVRWLAAGQACRGQQLLAGASIAQGDVLWFLHADVRLSSTSFVAMRQAIHNNAIGGFFRFRFDKPRHWPAFVLEPAIMLRCFFGVPYGDQGLFILRASYHEVGGHAPWSLFEEVPLVQGARQIGKFIGLRESIFVNPRRWLQDGWWRRTWHNRILALQFACGVTPKALAARYQAMKASPKHSHIKHL
ncbi:TIGR04283 family arsenosugar biosynthesis glycosyltransferase [Nitrosomonas aestuarii]|uniref:TIGR04283 family arsenosugar biosynthesis glycosyltransferase n=1 Tax=Nitrosomonas aestuarii TaxID=52441 RepID=UPI000D30121C|nr:TIGR04283 family arsenosugar biosynthesis glycosyltransferase [Nitrosomonas aestuarii]PTN12378.1 rSAM/selenodomain-associated transferase 2 [Nitrosomonas aestuarii]